jgi:hypothetical protein
MSCFLYVDDEESTRKINIDELYEKKQRRDLKQLSIFNKILNRIHRRIQHIGRFKKDEQHIWFTVPEYIFGEPIYDKGDCIAYLVVKLEENGFLVKYIHPNTLFVNWANWIPSYVRTEFRKKTGKIMDEKGNITDPRSGEQTSVDTMREEEDINARLFNHRGNPNHGGGAGAEPPQQEKKIFTPISKYKPTGNFVYNPDILEKIEKKVSFHI